MAYVTSADGTRIAYETSGQGPAVILIDGAMCYRELGPMRAMAAQLSDNFSVCIYDRRGRGESGDTLPYTPEREVEDLAALIEVAGGSAYLFGTSSGAFLALNAATALAGKVKKLALFEPPYSLDTERQTQQNTYVEALHQLLAEGKHDEVLQLFMRQVGLPEEMIAGAAMSPMWQTMKKLAPTLAYDAAQAGDGRIPHIALTIPVLVLGGDKSMPYMQKNVQALAGAIPNATLQMLKGQSHDFSPEVMAAALTPFLLG